MPDRRNTMTREEGPAPGKRGASSTARGRGAPPDREKQSPRRPLSEGQKGLWALRKETLETSAYNIPVCLRVRDALDEKMLRQACRSLLERRPVLTSVFGEDDGAPHRTTAPSRPLPFEKEDISTLASHEILPRIREKANAPFSLERGPLTRFHLLTRSEREHFVLITVHTIIFDDHSIPLLVETLLEDYLALVQGRPPASAPPGANYDDFVQWEREMLTGEKRKEHHLYWRRRLAGAAPAGSPPAEASSPPVRPGPVCVRPVSPDLSGRIHAFAQSHYTNPSIVFLGALNVVVHSRTGGADVIVGARITGRPRERFGASIGCFTNRAPIRTRVENARPLSKIIQALHFTVVDAVDHAACAPPVSVRDLNPPGAPTDAAAFHTTFVYRDLRRFTRMQRVETRFRDRFPAAFVEEIRQEGEYELELEVIEKRETFEVILKHDPGRFDADAVARMMASCEALLEYMVDHPDSTPGDFFRLSKEEAASPDRGAAGEDLLRNPGLAPGPPGLLPADRANDDPPLKALLLDIPMDDETDAHALISSVTDAPGMDDRSIAVFSHESRDRGGSRGGNRGGRRRAVFHRTRSELAAGLESILSPGEGEKPAASGSGGLVFMFAGTGEQYPGLGKYLYEFEPAYRASMDRCFAILKNDLDLDLAAVLFPAGETGAAGGAAPDGAGGNFRALITNADADVAFDALDTLVWSHVSTFVVEYALATWCMSTGVAPDAIIGHSLGEYAGACLAGIFSLEDALRIVVRRARLIQGIPESRMLAVLLPHEEMGPHLNDDIALAVVNSDQLCVAAGRVEHISALQRDLLESYISCKPLMSERAVHSPLLRELTADLRELYGEVDLHPPSIPLISNITGSWLAAGRAVDLDYWIDHACSTVRFDKGVAALLSSSHRVFLEIGAGEDLCGFITQNGAYEEDRVATIPTLPAQMNRARERSSILRSLGALWVEGKFKIGT